MSDKDFVELSFRFRPKLHTPDGILVRYLLSHKPTQRRRMILTALRTFYLVAAYGFVGNVKNLDQASEFIQVLKKTYGEGRENIVDDSLCLSIDFRINYMGATTLPYIDSDSDEEKEEEDDSDEDEDDY